MGSQCVKINMLAPANITANAITTTPIVDCLDGMCTVVSVTWQNTGDLVGTFVPTITLDGTPTTLSPESLDSRQSVTKTFPLTGLIAGNHTICAVPNTLPCTTVTVPTIAQADIGPFIIAGLAIGALFMARKKKKEQKNLPIS